MCRARRAPRTLVRTRAAKHLVGVVVAAAMLVFGGGTAHADINALLTAASNNVTAVFSVYYDDAAHVLTYTCVSYYGGPCPGGSGTLGYWISTFHNASNFMSTGSPGLWTSSVPLAIVTSGFGLFGLEQDAPLTTGMTVPLNIPVAFQFAGINPADNDFVANSAGNRFAVHVKTEQDCESVVAEQHESGTAETNSDTVSNAKCTGKSTGIN